MAITALSAAKKLCESSGWNLTNLQLQKILYLAQAVHLGFHEQPLFEEDFEAWDYGPVQPGVYHRAKIFGNQPVQNVFHDVPQVTDEHVVGFLEEAVRQLGNLPASKLVAVTHKPGGAWDSVYVPGQKGIKIPKERIKQEQLERQRGSV